MDMRKHLEPKGGGKVPGGFHCGQDDRVADSPHSGYSSALSSCFLEEVSVPAHHPSERAMNYAEKPQAWAGPS